MFLIKWFDAEIPVGYFSRSVSLLICKFNKLKLKVIAVICFQFYFTKKKKSLVIRQITNC